MPKLRFPGFEEAWAEKNIDSILVRASNGFQPDLDGTYREIGVRSHGRGIFHKEAVLGAALGEKRVFHVIPNALVLNIVFAWEQAVALTTDREKGFIASHRFPMFLEREGRSYLPFILELLLTKRGKQLLEMASPGGAGRNKTLGQQEFLRLKVKVPQRIEQKKIAAFLRAMDEKLGILRKKRDLLATYKRGVMQLLFSQTFRFKHDDGTDFPDWEEKRLGEVFDWVRTNNLSREHLTHQGGEIQNIHYGDIHTKFKANFRQAEESVPFISPSAGISGFADEEFCRLGDVVIADASEDYADIGKAIEVVNVRDKSLVAGQHTHLARPKSQQTALGFSGYLLRSAPMRRQIVRVAQGISVLGISKTNLERLILWLPHPDEQRRIADFLSALDTKIEAVAQQITQTDAFKKGLVQQMFL
ncbi:restriction endonuclease subunit S [Mesorhizobium sp. M0902]|uniref:restriction endonuclease subunit S n=1 Tax=Mesorhizobium sp. M0902 TaxID=2957021 RepID=UPI003339B9AF